MSVLLDRLSTALAKLTAFKRKGDPILEKAQVIERLAANELHHIAVWFRFDATGGAMTPTIPLYHADRRSEIIRARMDWVSVTVANNSTWALTNGAVALFAAPEDVDIADTGAGQSPVLLPANTVLEAGEQLDLDLSVANTAIVVGIVHVDYVVRELPNVAYLTE